MFNTKEDNNNPPSFGMYAALFIYVLYKLYFLFAI